MGAALGSVVTSMVKDLLTPLIAALVGKPSFAGWSFTVHGSQFLCGDFINNVFSFVPIGAAVYFAVVVPVKLLISKSRTVPRQIRRRSVRSV